MSLPTGFRFSQASLQDYVDCPRRFQLRYLAALKWPAVEAEPIERNEQRMALGEAFHRMVQQWFLGLSEEAISRAASDPDLLRWWQSFLAYHPVSSFCGDAEDTTIRSEYALDGEVVGHRLVAKYDVLGVSGAGKVTILDWKTSMKRTPDDALHARLQTRVYPFLAVQAGTYLNRGKAINPDDVELVYWFPESPLAPARMRYSVAQYEADGDYLADLIKRIAVSGDSDFWMTQDRDRCRFCVYRSYCERGTSAGRLDALAAEWQLDETAGDIDIDFEQIAEIAF